MRTARTLRADHWQGSLDITFFRSRRTDQQIASFGRFVLNALYAELRTAGFDQPGTKYLIYYDGTNRLTCGNALQEGPAAAVYLKGSYDGNSCIPRFSADPGNPDYLDFAMLHEVMHTLGAVHFNAPDHDDARRWHVSDRSDLMYGGGDFTWRPEHIDREGSAYFSTARLWDDGILDPRETRSILGLCLDIAMTMPVRRSHPPVFRM